MTGPGKADDGRPTTLADWQRIDSLCSSFEAAWAADKRPDPATFLGDFEGAARDRLFRELLAIELESRRSLGETPQALEYQDRFPGHHDAIDETFASMPAAAATLPGRGRRGPWSGESPTPGRKLGEAGAGLQHVAELNAVVIAGLGDRPVTMSSVSSAAAAWA